MTQWWRLLYDAGDKPVTRWLFHIEHRKDGRLLAEDHLGRRVIVSGSSPFLLQEIDELPPKQQREREEVLEDAW